MGKLTLSALAVLIKKAVVGVIKYINLKINANSVHIFEKATANSGYLKTYVVTTAASLAAVTALNTIGEIDIPKDFLLKDSVQLTVVEGTGDNVGKFMVTEEDNVAVATPYEANSQVNAAGSWLDLIVNTQAGDETAVHQLINLSKFIDVYSNGLGLNLSGKAFSIKLNATASGLSVDADGLKIFIDSSNANGLAITANGLKLAQATQSAAGAMSAADKTNLDGLVEDMDMNLVSNAEIASWMGYDITGTPAEGSEAAQIKTALEGVSSDSITDEPGA